jgi:hypothetical protein
MKVNITGIIMNIIMVLIIIALAIWGSIQSNVLHQCENSQSQMCYTIQCPCDDQSSGPCNGYAKMPSGDGNWYCSDSPYTKVDDNGTLVK